MNLRLGRFISVPGIEAQLAPNNYIFSHSLLYAIDPFTDTGLIATVKLNDLWLVQLGITDGHDIAPWTPTPSLPAPPASVHNEVRQRQSLLCAKRNQQRQVRLQQSAAVRHHLVSQVLEDGTHGNRILVYVRARRPRSRRNNQTGNRRQSCLLPARRAALHRSRVRRSEFLQKTTFSPQLFSPSAATFLTTRKASAPATPPNIPRTQSCGAIGSAPQSSFVRNCVSSAPGTGKPTTTSNIKINSP